MRNYIRADTPGATYFFTVALQDRSARWLVDQVDVLRECVAATKAQHPFRIDAMVVLPEHLHALWTLPPGDANFPLRWMLIKRRFTRQLLSCRVLDGAASTRRGDAERSLWQRRYWEHQVRDEDDFERHVDYIHFNPVKHGWAARAADWPHSSFHRFVREGRLASDWGLSNTPIGGFGERT
jgi:putative transposase